MLWQSFVKGTALEEKVACSKCFESLIVVYRNKTDTDKIEFQYQYFD